MKLNCQKKIYVLKLSVDPLRQLLVSSECEIKFNIEKVICHALYFNMHEIILFHNFRILVCCYTILVFSISETLRQLNICFDLFF